MIYEYFRIIGAHEAVLDCTDPFNAAHFTRAQVGGCGTQFGAVGSWVRCVLAREHRSVDTTSPHVANLVKRTA